MYFEYYVAYTSTSVSVSASTSASTQGFLPLSERLYTLQLLLFYKTALVCQNQLWLLVLALCHILVHISVQGKLPTLFN